LKILFGREDSSLDTEECHFHGVYVCTASSVHAETGQTAYSRCLRECTRLVSTLGSCEGYGAVHTSL
jgi:hypothetical protein